LSISSSNLISISLYLHGPFDKFYFSCKIKKISEIEEISGKEGIKKGRKKNKTLDSGPLEKW